MRELKYKVFRRRMKVSGMKKIGYEECAEELVDWVNANNVTVVSINESVRDSEYINMLYYYEKDV